MRPYCSTTLELTLIFSTVDIINVKRITAMAHVNHWVEENDEEIQNALYWRQAIDARNLELSVCYCLPGCHWGLAPS